MADEKAEDIPQQDAAPPNGVLVVKETNEQGISVNVVTTGDVQPTEVLTLLSLALKGVKADLGVD